MAKGLIPQQIIEDVNSRIDIVSVVSEHVQLKKSGKDYKGLCPFHQEKSPSFMVSVEKRIFHCFGCGTGGNAYSFLMKIEGLSFPEAVRKLAERVGVIVEELSDEDKSAYSRKELFYKINRYAQWFYAEELKSPAGKVARDYLESRGITPETSELFSLGYAPASGQALHDFFKSKKVPLEAAYALGLLRQNEGGRTYDFFRDRLLFPIQDHEKRVLGFSGRKLREEQTGGKYVNSSDSPIYHKSSSLFGIGVTKSAIRDKGSVILVEGNLDLVRMVQEGAKNVAAPLGTALTREQIAYLSRFAKDVVLCFDADQAGERACMKAIEICLTNSIHPKVVKLPEGDDPDSFIGKHGGAKFQTLVTAAQTALDWMMAKSFEGVGVEVADRIRVAGEILPFVSKLTNPLERRSYEVRLAHFLGLDEKELVGRGSVEKEPPRKTTIKKNSLERILLQIYLTFPHFGREILSDSVFASFEDVRLKECGIALLKASREEGSLSAERLLNSGEFDADLVSELMATVTFQNEDEAKAVFDECWKNWRIRDLKKKLIDLTSRIKLAELSRDDERLQGLLVEKSETMRELHRAD